MCCIYIMEFYSFLFIINDGISLRVSIVLRFNSIYVGLYYERSNF